jgi:hypothetical protein
MGAIDGRRFEAMNGAVSSAVDAERERRITSGVPAKPSALVDTRVIYCGDRPKRLRVASAEDAGRNRMSSREHSER